VKQNIWSVTLFASEIFQKEEHFFKSIWNFSEIFAKQKSKRPISASCPLYHRPNATLGLAALDDDAVDWLKRTALNIWWQDRLKGRRSNIVSLETFGSYGHVCRGQKQFGGGGDKICEFIIFTCPNKIKVVGKFHVIKLLKLGHWASCSWSERCVSKLKNIKGLYKKFRPKLTRVPEWFQICSNLFQV